MISSRTIISLFIFSLLVRLFFLIPVVLYDVPPLYDESGYFSRAIGYCRIMESLFDLKTPFSYDLRRAFGRGTWPPFHPFLISLVMLIVGKSVAASRFLMVIISALTTPLVFLLASRIFSKKAAIRSALIHIFYPAFIAFSHYLWSETVFIFLLFLSVYFSFLLIDSVSGRSGIKWSILAGIFFGLAALTRIIGLLLLLTTLAWMVTVQRGIRKKLLFPFLILIMFLTVILPWQTAITIREGQLCPLTTKSGWYLYLGNNPWLSRGGFSFNTRDKKQLMREKLDEYSQKYDITSNEAAHRLAREEILRSPTVAVKRAFKRLQIIWAADYFALRHIVRLVYPPLPPSVVAIFWLAVVGAYFVYLLIAARGLFKADWANPAWSLIAVLALVSIFPSLLTTSCSRLHLPLLALLLPAAGRGLTDIRQKLSLLQRLFLTGFFLLLCWFNIDSFTVIFPQSLIPSSYYHRLIARMGGLMGTETITVDRIALRFTGTTPPKTITITLPDQSHRFRGSDSRVFRWQVKPEKQEVELDIVTREISPLRMIINTGKDETTIFPIEKRYWRNWNPTPIDDIVFSWRGGGRPE